MAPPRHLELSRLRPLCSSMSHLVDANHGVSSLLGAVTSATLVQLDLAPGRCHSRGVLATWRCYVCNSRAARSRTWSMPLSGCHRKSRSHISAPPQSMLSSDQKSHPTISCRESPGGAAVSRRHMSCRTRDGERSHGIVGMAKSPVES